MQTLPLLNLHETLVIVGSGPAGLTAALYAARAGLSPLIISGEKLGGAIATSESVQNWPGMLETTGQALIDSMLDAALAHGARISSTVIKKIEINPDGTFMLTCGTGGKSGTIVAKSIILACGTTYRKLGIPGESEYWGHGVSVCSTCDAPLFKDKTVAVVGGGYSAAATALTLSKYAAKIYVLNRESEFAPSVTMAQATRLTMNSKISVLTRTEACFIAGMRKIVTQMTVRNIDSHEERTLSVDGVFLAIGTIPNTGFLDGLVKCDARGYVICQADSTATSVPGIFAAGDLVDSKYHQAITAAASGCRAALDCEYYLTGKIKLVH